MRMCATPSRFAATTTGPACVAAAALALLLAPASARAFVLAEHCDPSALRCEIADPSWVSPSDSGSAPAKSAAAGGAPEVSRVLEAVGADPVLAEPSRPPGAAVAGAVSLCAGSARYCDPGRGVQLAVGTLDVVPVLPGARGPGGVRALSRIAVRFDAERVRTVGPEREQPVRVPERLLWAGLAGIGLVLLLTLWAVFRRRPYDEIFEVQAREVAADEPPPR